MHTYLFILCKKNNQNPKKTPKKTQSRREPAAAQPGWGGNRGNVPDWERLGGGRGGQTGMGVAGPPPGTVPGIRGGRSPLPTPPPWRGGRTDFFARRRTAKRGASSTKRLIVGKNTNCPPPPPRLSFKRFMDVRAKCLPGICPCSPAPQISPDPAGEGVVSSPWKKKSL